MKKEEITQVSQYCLDGLSVFDFVKRVPNNFMIQELQYRGLSHSSAIKIPVDAESKAAGITVAKINPAQTEILGVIKRVMPHDQLIAGISKVAKKYKIDAKNIFVRRVTVVNKTRTASLTFRRFIKTIKLPNDTRRGIRVLGLEVGNGSYHDMLADMSAKKFTCTFAKTEKSIVLCTEEAVTK
jgi:hypothetical protein